LELKSVRRVVIAHELQLINYLSATHKDMVLLINFGEKNGGANGHSPVLKRKVRELPENSSEG
jgi:hypothetical protein